MRKGPRRVLTFLGLTALWLLLVGQFSWPELGAGALGALLATGAGALSDGSVHPVFRISWLSRAPGPLLRIFPDTAKVLWAVVRGCVGRAPRGQFVIVPAPDAPGEREDEAKLAAHVLGISLAPNSFVAELPTSERGYVVHQLVDAPPPTLEALP